LTGGSDVNPALYWHGRSEQCGEPDDERDAFELELLSDALARDLPILAICRGMQLFNVAHSGGTLKQHIEGHEVRDRDPAESTHDVEPATGTRLAAIFGATPLPVNSRHHQAVDAVGTGLLVSALSCADSVIEALERPDLRFALAVQWHPEDQIRRYPRQLRLFEAFAGSLYWPSTDR
jgi:gamma-glutamyl-gamma-aminobutyrate hydrolase PuuD